MFPFLTLLCSLFPPTGGFFFNTNASEDYDDVLIDNPENQEYLKEFLPEWITQKGTMMARDPGTQVGEPVESGRSGFDPQSNVLDLVTDVRYTDYTAVFTCMPSSSSHGIGSSTFSGLSSSLTQFDGLQSDLLETKLSIFEASPRENLSNAVNTPTTNVGAATLPCGEKTNTKVTESVVASKGTKWSEKENKSFLKGIKLYGRSWKTIANNVLFSRTPDQISNHAHKFFKRLQDTNQKRRKSVYDITTLDGHRLNIYDIAQWCNVNRKKLNTVGHTGLSPPLRNN